MKDLWNTMRSLSIWMAVSWLFLPFLLFTGCSDSDQINIYSSRHYDTDLELFDRFSEQTGIEVNLIEGGSDELIERIKNEGINSPADLVITVDAGRLWRAKEANVLQPLDSERLNSVIPAHFRDPDGYWYGLSQRVRGMMYNKNRVDRSDLEGYWELGEDKWNGRICMRSSGNIYNQSLVASLIEVYGLEDTEDWARRLVSNFARSPQGGDTDQIRAVAAGQCDLALANHYYLARLINSASGTDRAVAEQIGIYFPGEEFGGAHVNISGAGLAAHAPNRENAVRFLEFLTEESSQVQYAGENYEFPVVEGVDKPEVLELFGPFESEPVNVAVFGRNNPDAIRLMDRAGWR